MRAKLCVTGSQTHASHACPSGSPLDHRLAVAKGSTEGARGASGGAVSEHRGSTEGADREQVGARNGLSLSRLELPFNASVQPRLCHETNVRFVHTHHATRADHLTLRDFVRTINVR